MTSNTLKVEASSHCTTPSEMIDPGLVSVKVGCLNINPGTKKGRQQFLVQMLILCFVPHIALLIQNCTMMAQFSYTLDSALYLNKEVDAILSVGELAMSLQEERCVIAEFLFQETTLINRTFLLHTFSVTDLHFDAGPFNLIHADQERIYDFRNTIEYEQLKKTPLQRLSVYNKVNRELLVYMTSQVKGTISNLWRQLSSCYELLNAIEDMSVAYVFYTYHTSTGSQPHEAPEVYHRSAMDHLSAASQFLKIEKLVDEATVLDDVAFIFNQSIFKPQKDNRQSTVNYISNMKHCLKQLKDFQLQLWMIVRRSVNKEVWMARRTLAVGVTILVVVLMASPVLIILLKHTVLTIQIFTQSIDTSTQRLMAEKQKSDLLLSRMLPLPVLRRLRAQKTVPAESFDAVTIFFSDIVGFTTISAYSTPMEVINMLNMLYRLFDEKIQQYNVYKVETIGDAYMVVSGLPQRNGNLHASEIADMSLSLMRSLQGATVPHKSDEPLRIRAGVNTGPCVAGVVGTTMPRYCLFGDTINTASRMESTGEAMKIHISDSTKKALDTVGNYEVESRGMLDVPLRYSQEQAIIVHYDTSLGKGKMETFWLLRKIQETENDSPNRVLNDYDQNLLEIIIK